ncbi:MAG: hypothetical protein FWG92_02940 [Leptospirales bacterium]|nr:hypothetical protein [Leptospirales bacterium]
MFKGKEIKKTDMENIPVASTGDIITPFSAYIYACKSGKYIHESIIAAQKLAAYIIIIDQYNR